MSLDYLLGNPRIKARSMPLPSLSRMAAGHPRTLLALLCGVFLFAVLPHGWRLPLRSILAWDGGAALLLLLSAFAFAYERLDRMEADAEAQREGEWTIFAVTLVGVSASFVAIVQEFPQAKEAHGQYRVALVVVTLLLSWLVTHVCFAFRYAHEYYERDLTPSGDRLVAGGLDFPGGQTPDYWDFLYFSLVLGMTFQVSDVEITTRKFRRMATLHGFLGFMFNTVLLAFAVNLAAGLL